MNSVLLVLCWLSTMGVAVGQGQTVIFVERSPEESLHVRRSRPTPAPPLGLSPKTQGSDVSALAVAEAITAGESASSVAKSIAELIRNCYDECQCISDCGQVVVEAISAASVTDEGSASAADAFAEVLACDTGDTQVTTYAEAIAEALSTGGPAYTAIALALAKAKETGGCESIASALTQAHAIAEGIGGGAAQSFTNAVAVVGVDDCLSSPHEPAAASSGALSESAESFQRIFKNIIYKAKPSPAP